VRVTHLGGNDCLLEASDQRGNQNALSEEGASSASNGSARIRGELKKRKFMHARTGPLVSLGIEGDGNVLRRLACWRARHNLLSDC
jgi:hypothetical protein